MIGDEVIQAAIVAKLKALAPFGDVQPVEVREFEWQGDEFTYPNIRVELEDNRYYYDEQERCSLQYVEFSVYVFSQQRSSKECSQIKTLVTNAMVGIGFNDTTRNLRFTSVRVVDNIPVVREDARTWRSQIKLSSKVSNLS